MPVLMRHNKFKLTQKKTIGIGVAFYIFSTKAIQSGGKALLLLRIREKL